MNKKVPPEVKKADKAQGKLPVKCRAVYHNHFPGTDCYLRPAEAIEAAQNLLVKARLIKNKGDDLFVVLRAASRRVEFFIQVAAPSAPRISN